MSKRRNATANIDSAPQQVRIIAGCWKGRSIPVIKKEDVRPTPNRVRETVFNWLQDALPGSRCLDLFAGSGVLGIESVSRGAAHATIVDSNREIIELLRSQLELLETGLVDLVCGDGIEYILNTEQQFDIVYLDPPFQKFDLNKLLDQVNSADILKPHAQVYMESLPGQLPQKLPSSWQWRRQSKASQVAYGLIATG